MRPINKACRRGVQLVYDHQSVLRLYRLKMDFICSKRHRRREYSLPRIDTAAVKLSENIVFGDFRLLMVTTTVQPFYDPLSGTTHVSRYQKDKPFWILDQADMMGWQWHQLNRMPAICTSLQKITTPATHQSDFYGPDALR